MINQYRNKISSILLISILSILGSFAIMQISVSIAHAESIELNVSDTKTFNSGDNTGNLGNGPGGGGGGNNNSGKLQPKPIPKACSAVQANASYHENNLPSKNMGWDRWHGGCLPKYKENAEFLPPPVGCPVSTAHGIIRNAVGMMVITKETLLVTVIFNTTTSSSQTFYTYVFGSRRGICVYPKVSKVESPEVCALNATGNFDRMANSRKGPGRIQTFKKTFATINGLKKETAKCNSKPNMSFTTNLPNTASNWGQYTLTGQIQYAWCQKTIVTFDGKSTTHYKCGSPIDADAVTSKLTLWCGDPIRAHVPKLWNMNDCGPNSQFKCTVPTPMYDGKKGTVQTLRDGKSRILNWGTPTTDSNVRNTRAWEQSLTINKGSSPRLTSVGDNDKSKQMFWSNVSFGANWASSKNQQSLAFYNASNPGSSWSATRKLRFDAQFKTTITNVKSYNPFTGAVSTSTRKVWVADSNINCATGVSPNIQALRSIGDAQ